MSDNVPCPYLQGHGGAIRIHLRCKQCGAYGDTFTGIMDPPPHRRYTMKHISISLLLAATLTTWSDPTPAPGMREFYRVLEGAEGLTTQEQYRADDLEALLKRQHQEQLRQQQNHFQQQEYQIRQLQQQLRQQR